MKIRMYVLTYYLLLLLIAGITIDTLETWYGLNHGLSEANLITLFIIYAAGNTTAGILMSGILKVVALLMLYVFAIIIKNTIITLSVFSRKFIIITLDMCIILFLIIANYTTYYAVCNNLILILR